MQAPRYKEAHIINKVVSNSNYFKYTMFAKTDICKRSLVLYAF